MFTSYVEGKNDGKERYFEVVRKFFDKHDKGKSDKDIRRLMSKYQGREGKMRKMLEKKYNETMDDFDRADAKNRQLIN